MSTIFARRLNAAMLICRDNRMEGEGARWVVEEKLQLKLNEVALGVIG